jgi:endonuclease YncB( thermonuclease family)
VGPERLTSAAAAVAAGIALAGCSGSAGPDGTASLEVVEGEHGVVARVTDGDTLRLLDGRRVRLVQIDAPEAGECFARAATRALARRLPGSARVLLVRDPALDGRDEHGRLLRYVLLSGRNLNVELVREGAAAPYFFRRARGLAAAEILAAAEDARADRRGMWGACPRARFDPYRGSLTGRA